MLKIGKLNFFHRLLSIIVKLNSSGIKSLNMKSEGMALSKTQMDHNMNHLKLKDLYQKIRQWIANGVR